MTIIRETLSGRPCGAIEFGADGAARLIKKVNPDRHQLRKPPAWAIAVEHLEELRELAGAAGVVELVGPGGERWTASVGDFDQHGFDVVRGGFEAQRGLGLRWWRAETPGEQQLGLPLGVAS